MYLIGGANREATSFSDVVELDLQTRVWKKIQPLDTSDAFPARSGHSAVAIGHLILVFGGMNAVKQEIYDEMYTFDTRKLLQNQKPKRLVADLTCCSFSGRNLSLDEN